MRCELLVFDCDGVLVESERVYSRVLCVALAPHGVGLSVEQVFRTYCGRAWSEVRLEIEALLGGAFPDGFEDRFGRDLDAALRADLRPVPGVPALIESLTVPFCVASNSLPHEIRTSLEVTGLLPRFEGRIFSAAEVRAPKPAPDVYLRAAEAMECDPARAIVIEDTPVGVAAGVAAGMTVWGYTGTVGADALVSAGASRCFDDMVALREVFSGRE